MKLKQKIFNNIKIFIGFPIAFAILGFGVWIFDIHVVWKIAFASGCVGVFFALIKFIIILFRNPNGTDNITGDFKRKY